MSLPPPRSTTDLRLNFKEDIPPLLPVRLGGTGVGTLGACASPQGLAPSPHYGLSYTNDSGCRNPDLLLDSSMAIKPGSTVGGALDNQSGSPGFDPCLGHHSSILQNLDSRPLSQSSVSLPPPYPRVWVHWARTQKVNGALGTCASPQGLTPSTHSDLSDSNNSGCPNPDLLLYSLLVTNPGSMVGSAPDRQSSSPRLDPCLGHHSSILKNLDSWPLGQSSVSLPPVLKGLGPLGQDAEGYDALGACASPQGLTPSPRSDLSYSNNSSCLDPDLLPDSLLVAKPGSTVGSALDQQSSRPGFDPCLGHHLSILQNLDSWPSSQLSVSLPPIPLGLSPL